MFDNNILNKGIPANLPKPIEFSLDVLLQSAKKINGAKEYLRRPMNDGLDHLSNLTGFNLRRRFTFVPSYLLFTNEAKQENQLVVDPRCLLRVVDHTLNVSVFERGKDSDYLDSLRRKIDQLEQISHCGDLLVKFPEIYRLGRAEIAPQIEIGKMTLDEAERHLVHHTAKEYACLLRRVIDHYEEFQVYCLTHPIDMERTTLTYNEKAFSYYSHDEKEYNEEYLFDQKRLHFDIMSGFLRVAENEENVFDKQQYLYYVSDYYAEGVDLEDRKERDIYLHYVDLLKKNPGLLAITLPRRMFMGKSYQEVETMMAREMNHFSNSWSPLCTTQDERLESALAQSNPEQVEAFQQKKAVYEACKPLRVYEGYRAFKGYRAFFYANGKVIMEKFFERNPEGKEVLSSSDDIYIMTYGEFCTFTMKTRTEEEKDRNLTPFLYLGSKEETTSLQKVFCRNSIVENATFSCDK